MAKKLHTDKKEYHTMKIPIPIRKSLQSQIYAHGSRQEAAIAIGCEVNTLSAWLNGADVLGPKKINRLLDYCDMELVQILLPNEKELPNT